ncbi:MAG: glycosyltransferase family 4 protein [Pirellulaceae bacterium]|nr:glycosyltransferase family 4 protein [Pirellulaceae bacterium]
MAGQVQFYVNRVHSIGGVTTWSFQAASYMANRYRTRVVTVNTGAQPTDGEFPGQVTEVFRDPEDALRVGDDSGNGSTPERPTKPTKTTKPAKPAKKPVKPTKPVKRPKPVKPAKKPTQPLGAVPSNGSRQEPAEFTNGAMQSRRQQLHHSAQQAIESAELFIPNYLDFAYELAARSRASGNESRCIGICHCDHDNYYSLLSRYEPIIHSFIAVSPRCMETLIRRLPEREPDIHLVPYGVESPVEAPIDTYHGPIRLLYSGRLSQEQKRVFDLIEIVRELDSHRVDYTLDVVGSGPDRESLIDAFAGAPRVEFHPGVPHTAIAQVYQNHDVFLLPSQTEGTSIALLESMSSGLVPVATCVSGSEDVIVHGKNGFLCEVADVRAMAQCIAAIAANPVKRIELAQQARQTVRQHYRIVDQLAAFERCVQETLEKPLVSIDAARSVLGRALRNQ